MPSPRSEADPRRPARPQRGISQRVDRPRGYSTITQPNQEHVDNERCGGIPLHTEMTRQTDVVLDIRLQTVRFAQQFARHEEKLVENLVQTGLRRVVEQNQLVSNAIALENLASCLQKTLLPDRYHFIFVVNHQGQLVHIDEVAHLIVVRHI